MSARIAVLLLCLAVVAGPSAAVEEPGRVVKFGTVKRLTPRGAPVRQLDDAAFDQDLAELVAAAAGLAFRIVEFQTAPEVLVALENGGIDVIPSMARLPERMGKYLFSVRHTVSTAALFMPAGRRTPGSLAEVAALRLVAVSDSSASSYVHRKGLLDRTHLVPTTEAAMQAVTRGEADACISNQLVGLSVLRQVRLAGRIVPVFTLPDSAVDFCMVVRPEDDELLARLNDGLLLASERGDLQRHRERWLPAFESYWLTQPSVRRWLGLGGGVVALVALVTWLWYRARLRAERRLTGEVTRLVEIRTRELAAANAQLRASEDAVRRLNTELEARVASRTAELAERVAQVERLNAELEAFSYSVSHDLRAPLRNITGFLELLARRMAGRLDAESDRFVHTVTREATRLGRLIDSLLEFSRLGRAELACGRVALDELVAEVRAALPPELGAPEIAWRLGELPVVAGDRGTLRLVLENLLRNAAKFSRHRRPAVIEVGRLPPAAGESTVTCFVRDNGAGFNPKYADKLFGVFQRLHNARDFEGTGIGLANVKRIISRHGGRVWAEGSVDNGAAFYFTLPLYPSSPS